MAAHFDEQLLEFPTVLEHVASRAVCAAGRRRILKSHPLIDRSVLLQEMKLVTEMTGLVEASKEPPLHGLRDVEKHLVQVRRERGILEPQELLDLKDFLDTAGAMRAHFEAMQETHPALHALAMPLQRLPALYRNIDEKIAPSATVRDSASPLLAELRADISSTETAIQNELSRMVRELAASGELQDDFYTLRNDRYVLPVKTNHRGKVQGIIHDSSNTGETVFIEPYSILEKSNLLADLRLREKEEIYRILLRIAGHIRDDINALLTNLELLAEFDGVLARARFGHQHECSFPSVVDVDRPIDLREAHHPLLKILQPNGSVAINLALDSADKVLVITGPNAGGKTTALKTVGLIAMMVQAGIPVPVDPRSRLPIFHRILANIGDEQSITEGRSTFSGHMARLAEMLRLAEQHSLLLLDELGTATDPVEGGALAVAVLEHLADASLLTIVSTHLAALKSWAHTYPSGRNAAFRLGERDMRPTYRITLDTVGISEALVVAEHAGLPQSVLQRARQLRPDSEGDATQLLLSLQRKEEELSHELARAEQLRSELEDAREEFQVQQNALRDEKRTYRVTLEAEKEKEIAELRARVEKLIQQPRERKELQEVRQGLNDAQKESAQNQQKLRGQPATASGKLSPGDSVHVISLNDRGTVVSVDEGRKQARVSVRKVTLNLPMGQLRKVAAPAEPAGGAVLYRRPQNPSSMLDLHGFRVEDALVRVDKFFDEALASGFSRVKIMHGQGSGALRKALHEHFRTNPAVKNYNYGQPDEGGGGVTEVEFK